MRNAQMSAKHGGTVVLHKLDLTDAAKLKSTFEEVLSNPSYARNSERLSQMLRNQPISPKELLLKHVNFAANSSTVSS
ncbi:unnamed protein product [Strongylus vulgaris]|uniref:glucuronosyltransferase n=1 Tax=Strongylus vulgaris TaxID=40348 RepID=A0A3P7IZN2_STRVU|nr:unnamed protein product [Strongylus vulgaris]